MKQTEKWVLLRLQSQNELCFLNLCPPSDAQVFVFSQLYYYEALMIFSNIVGDYCRINRLFMSVVEYIKLCINFVRQ